MKGHVARFYREVVLPYEGDDCLIWPYCQTGSGYGQMGRPKRSIHRLVCEAVNGPCPSGQTAAHSCGRSLCVNKRHIRWATQSDNLSDKKIHGTHVQGEACHLSRLTESAVLEIRALKGAMSTAEIGRRYGVTQSNVSAIHLRKSWKHI